MIEVLKAVKTALERFNEKIDKRGSYPGKVQCRVWPEIKGTRCHEWTAALSRDGYGQFHFNGRTVQAHRFSYELKHGKGSLGDEECNHKCDNRKCVRQSHLFKGTRLDGSDDKVVKGRQDKKLTKIRVRVIRSLHAVGGKQKVLAKQFDVTRTQIGLIVNRKSWRHVK
jgi:hypothetical protein